MNKKWLAIARDVCAFIAACSAVIAYFQSSGYFPIGTLTITCVSTILLTLFMVLLIEPTNFPEEE